MESNDLFDISENLFDLIINLNKKVFSMDRIMRGLPIPQSQVKVIYYLLHNDSSPVSEIAKNLSISKPNMTPIIDNLISNDYVHRYYDQKDRRIIRIKLTDKAKDFVKMQQTKTKSMLAEKISTLSESELSELQSCVFKITNIVSKLD